MPEKSNRTALIGSIQKFSTQDGPGIRTTVFLKGCPLRCVWCHNPEMISPHRQMMLSPSRCIRCMECTQICPEQGITVTEEGPVIDFARCRACGECAEVCFAKAITPVAEEMTVEQVMEHVLKDRDFYESSGGGVTLSGGEVLMHADFASEILDACKEESIDVCLDTCGFGERESLMDLASRSNVQHVLYDIKHTDDGRHRELTGQGNRHIFDNLRALAAEPVTRKKIWIRIPLIHGVNDDDENISRTIELMNELSLKKVSLLPYHEMGVAKAKHSGLFCEKFQAPSEERLENIRKLFSKEQEIL